MKRIASCFILVTAAFTMSSFAIGAHKGNTPSFTENKGQLRDQNGLSRNDILYYGSEGALDYYIHNKGISYQVLSYPEVSLEELSLNRHGNTFQSPGEIIIHRVDVTWKNANPLVVSPESPRSAVENYYLSHAGQAIEQVRSFEALSLEEIYDGISLRYYYEGGSLKYDFNVNAGTDYKKIRMQVEGAELAYGPEGSILIKTSLGDIREDAPAVFQSGKQLPARWVITGKELSYEVDNYNPALPLLIDPLVRLLGTYYGGTASEWQSIVASDSTGNMYVATSTFSATGIATSGAFIDTLSGNNINSAVAKFDNNGQLLWGTYVGGYSQTVMHGIRSDHTGNLFVSGWTHAPTLPLSGGYQLTMKGYTDGLLMKFGPAGTLVWGTYYGDTLATTQFGGMAMDPSGNIYVGGNSSSSSVLATSGTSQPFSAGSYNGILAKFSASGARIWGTYCGGNNLEFIDEVALSGNSLFVSGRSYSVSGVATAGTHQQTNGGNCDVYLVKFDTNGTKQWATYFGGSDLDFTYGLQANSSGDVYLSGITKSISGIATTGAYQQSYPGGSQCMYLAKFSGSGILQWSTYLGGPQGSDGGTVVLTSGVYPLLLGHTISSGLGTAGAWQPLHSDAIYLEGLMTKFDTAGSLIWSSYFGAYYGQEVIYGGYADPYGGFYISGEAVASGTFASTPGTHQTSIAGTSPDCFINHFSDCGDPHDTLQEIACQMYILPSGSDTITISGSYKDTLLHPSGCPIYYTLNVTVSTLDTTVVQNGINFSATASGASYQWIDCSTGNPIAGATSQQFTAQSNGSYALVITKNGCTDTTDCRDVNGVGVMENKGKDAIVFPNPVKNILQVEWEGTQGEVELIDLTGRVLRKEQLEGGQAVLKMNAYAPGVYLIRIKTAQGSVVKKVEKL